MKQRKYSNKKLLLTTLVFVVFFLITMSSALSYEQIQQSNSGSQFTQGIRDGHDITSTTPQLVGQSFTPLNSYIVDDITLSLQRVNTANGFCKVRFYTMTDSVTPDTQVGSEISFDANLIGTGETFITLTSEERDIDLIGGQQYGWILSCDDPTMNARVRGVATTNFYSGGTLFYKPSGSTTFLDGISFEDAFFLINNGQKGWNTFTHTSTPDYSSQGLYFNTTDGDAIDTVYPFDNTGFNTNGATFFMRVNITESDLGVNNFLFGLYDTSGSPRFLVNNVRDTGNSLGNTLLVEMQDGLGGVAITRTNEQYDETTYWLGVTYNYTTGDVQLYVDGVQQTYQTDQDLAGIIFDYTTADTFSIGRTSDTDTITRLNGYIRDFTIYNRTLSPSEMSSITSAENLIVDDSLTAYYRFTSDLNTNTDITSVSIDDFNRADNVNLGYAKNGNLWTKIDPLQNVDSSITNSQLRFVYTGGGGSSYTTEYVDVDDYNTISFDVYINNTNNDNGILLFRSLNRSNVADDDRFFTRFANGVGQSTLQYFDGSTWNSVTTFNYDQWYTITLDNINYETFTYDILVDNVYITTAPFRNNIGNLADIEFGVLSGDFYIDNLDGSFDTIVPPFDKSVVTYYNDFENGLNSPFDNLATDINGDLVYSSDSKIGLYSVTTTATSVASGIDLNDIKLGNGQWSYSLWVKPSSNDTIVPVLQQYSGGVAGRYLARLQDFDTDGNYSVATTSGTTGWRCQVNVQDSYDGIPANEWSLITTTFQPNNNNNWSVYRNDELVVSCQNNVASVQQIDTTLFDEAFIVESKIDQLVVADGYVFTLDNITSLYNNGDGRQLYDPELLIENITIETDIIEAGDDLLGICEATINSGNDTIDYSYLWTVNNLTVGNKVLSGDPIAVSGNLLDGNFNTTFVRNSTGEEYNPEVEFQKNTNICGVNVRLELDGQVFQRSYGIFYNDYNINPVQSIGDFPFNTSSGENTFLLTTQFACPTGLGFPKASISFVEQDVPVNITTLNYNYFTEGDNVTFFCEANAPNLNLTASDNTSIIVDIIERVPNDPSINPLLFLDNNSYVLSDNITLNSTGINISYLIEETFNWPLPVTYSYGFTNGFATYYLVDNTSNTDGTLLLTSSDVPLTSTYNWFVESLNSEGTNFTTSSETYYLCVNNWVADDVACINDQLNRTYTDLNNCGEQYDLPSDANTIVVCDDGIISADEALQEQNLIRLQNSYLLLFIGLLAFLIVIKLLFMRDGLFSVIISVMMIMTGIASFYLLDQKVFSIFVIIVGTLLTIYDSIRLKNG